MKVKRICNLYGENRGTGFAGNVFDKEKLCPTITTMQGGGTVPMIIDERISVSIDDFYSNREERVFKDIAPALRSERSGLKTVVKQTKEYRIRKLTPRECWRLMGYTDTDFEKASRVVSDSQLYKQAGNAIVKQVLMAIFSQLNIQNQKLGE